LLTLLPVVGLHTAIYPFEANGKYQISLALGDFVKIQEQIQDWYKVHELDASCSYLSCYRTHSQCRFRYLSLV